MNTLSSGRMIMTVMCIQMCKNVDMQCEYIMIEERIRFHVIDHLEML